MPTRRFFFDDGSSCKQWQITLRGSTQAVAYGRIGGDIFTLSLNRHFGCVYFWDHETDTFENDEKFIQSDGHLLAGSFDEFLARIATFSED